jgi:hypothetical protein
VRGLAGTPPDRSAGDPWASPGCEHVFLRDGGRKRGRVRANGGQAGVPTGTGAVRPRAKSGFLVQTVGG